MVSVGRVVCVALPFVLAVVSIIALLVAGLAGVTDKSLYMFQLNTTGLTLSQTTLLSLVDKRDTNLTAADLGIGKLYDINLWNYCITPQSGSRNCTKATYNWAAAAVNETEETFKAKASAASVSLELPDAVTKSLSVFVTLSRWTQIVFIVAFVSLALEILVGAFTSCSRAISCVTFLVAVLTATFVTAAAGLATATAVVVVGVIDSTAKWYGVLGSLNTRYLAAVWIAAAAALAASFFWMFTVCCCKPESRFGGSGRHYRNRGVEPTMSPAAVPLNDKQYQPLHDGNDGGYYNNHGTYNSQYGAPRQAAGRSDLAYEPYSHSRV